MAETLPESIRMKKAVGLMGGLVRDLEQGKTYPVGALGEGTAQGLVDQGYAEWAGRGSTAANAAPAPREV